jgi:hypothetical protein
VEYSATVELEESDIVELELRLQNLKLSTL